MRGTSYVEPRYNLLAGELFLLSVSLSSPSPCLCTLLQITVMKAENCTCFSNAVRKWTSFLMFQKSWRKQAMLDHTRLVFIFRI